MNTTVLGYPRIGARLELKEATEAYWNGQIGEAELQRTAAALRRQVWEELRDAGIAHIPSNTFSLYDQVLDTAVLFGAVPPRFADLPDPYFAMARGADGIAPLEMAQWFDTRYHHVVPEVGPGTRPRLAGDKPLAEYAEAKALGIETRPVLVGPLSFLLLAKADTPGFRTLDLLGPLLDAYAELLDRLYEAGVEWVQLDEPALAADRTDDEIAALSHAYERLGAARRRPRLLVATYFGEVGDDVLRTLARAPLDGIGLDFVAGYRNLESLARIGGIGDKTLVAGVIDGRNVWRTHLPSAFSTCSSLLGFAGQVEVGTSCSLQHVPLDLDAETRIGERLRIRLAFARQKVEEVVLVGRALREGVQVLEGHIAPPFLPGEFIDLRVRAQLNWVDGLDDGGRSDHVERRQEAMPTIGSFSTAEIRKARDDRRAGRTDDAAFSRSMRSAIDEVVAAQENLGVDVIVHGEPGREDMVEFFAERLGGFACTELGWVQASGSRYVRPPILFADVARRVPIIDSWVAYAQSRTRKPVMGVLAGPVTMLAWSFVRADVALSDSARLVALALRDEICDLAEAGVRVIRVFEPGRLELMPLRRSRHQEYLDLVEDAFRLATSGVSGATRIL